MNTPRIASSRRLDSHCTALVAILVPLVSSPIALAEVTTWVAGAKGSWFEKNNWNPRVPRPDDRAVIVTGTARIKPGEDDVTPKCSSLTIGGPDAGGGCELESDGLTFKSYLKLAAGANTSGFFTLKDGTLTGLDTIVGESGAGTFTQSGGRHGTNQLRMESVKVGVQLKAEGVYAMSGGELFTKKLDVGVRNKEGSAKFTMVAGTAEIRLLHAGVEAAGKGAIKIQGGTVESVRSCRIGQSGTGVLELSDTGVLDVKHDPKNASFPFIVGEASTAVGTLNLFGGTFKATSSGTAVPALCVGGSGKGTLTVNDGDDHLVTGEVRIAASPGSEGTVNASGGLLDIDGDLILSCAPLGLKPAGTARLYVDLSPSPVNLRVRKKLLLPATGDGLIQLANRTRMEVGSTKLPAGTVKGKGSIVKYPAEESLDGEPFVVGGPDLEIEPDGGANPHGELFFGGDAVLEGGTIAIDIDGTAPGVDLDQVRFAGPLSAYGTTIAVSFGPSINLAALPEGTAFPIIAAASFDGWFECLLPPTGNPSTSLALVEVAVLGDDGLESWQTIVVTSAE